LEEIPSLRQSPVGGFQEEDAVSTPMLMRVMWEFDWPVQYKFVAPEEHKDMTELVEEYYEERYKIYSFHV
jgi:hypothetical protein